MQQGTAVLAISDSTTTARQTRTSGMTDERLKWHLDNWKEWHHRRFGFFRRMWYPKFVPGIGFTRGSMELATMEHHVDTNCAKAVEALVNESMTSVQQCAMDHFLLHAVFRFPRANAANEFKSAIEIVRRGLTARGFY